MATSTSQTHSVWSEFTQKPLVISAFFHLSIVTIFFALSMRNFQTPVIKKVEFTVIQEPRALSRPFEEKPVMPPLAKKIEKTPAKAVFGVRKNSLTISSESSSESTVSIKEGNTLAKENDQEKLHPEDAEALPNPTEEFLVSSMPVLISEVRIPYPKQAREANIEGPVVMEILIDADGKVRSATLISGPGYGLDEAALTAVKGFRFKPAQVDQSKVAVKIRYTYRFVLEAR